MCKDSPMAIAELYILHDPGREDERVLFLN